MSIPKKSDNDGPTSPFSLPSSYLIGVVRVPLAGDEGISDSPSVFLLMYDITKKLDRFCGKRFLRAAIGKEMFTQE